MTDAERRAIRAEMRGELVEKRLAAGWTLTSAMGWAFEFEMLLRRGLNRIWAEE